MVTRSAALAIADRLTTAQLTTLRTYGSFYLQGGVMDGISHLRWAH